MRLPEIFAAVCQALGNAGQEDNFSQAFGIAFEEQALSEHSLEDDIAFSQLMALGHGYILCRMLDAYLHALRIDGLWPFRHEKSSARRFTVHPAMDGVVKTLERLARWQADSHRTAGHDGSTTEQSWAQLIEGVHEELEAIVERSLTAAARPEDGPYADFAGIVAAQDEDRGKAGD